MNKTNENKKLKKQLLDYVKENLPKGYSLEATRKACTKRGYDKAYTDDLIKTYKKQSNIAKYSVVALILILFSLTLFFIQPAPTGFVAVTKEYNYSDNIDLVVDNSYEYTWFMSNIGTLKSLKLGGSFVPKSLSEAQTISKGASAKVYLEYEGESYLVFDSLRLGEEGIGIITGLVISNESELVNNSTNNESLDNVSIPSTNETIDESEPLGNENKSTENEFSEPYLTSLNKTMIITTQGGGSKDIREISEFNVSSEFSWDVDYSKVCTKWDVNSIDVGVSVCYGSEDCCALIGLGNLGSWNDAFYLSYGRYDAGLSNIVKAQVIYANYSLDIENSYADIVYSDVDELEADFYYSTISFRDVCIDTCLLPGFDAASYKLIINVSDGTLELGKISYSILEEVTNVSVVNVSEAEELEQLKAEINKPVKWIRRSSNKTISIPNYAYNLSINKIINNQKSSVNKTKIKNKGWLKDLEEFEVDQELEKWYGKLEKTKGRGAIRELQERIDSLLELKQSFVPEEAPDNETAVIINETADSYEVEYETEAPLATEELISDNVKRIIISSNISYTNVLAYTNITESPSSAIKLYWYKNDSRVEVTKDAEINLILIDTNYNGLVDRLEWNVPHLSEQVFEIEINILNVQSYPMVGGNWTVMFNTTGAGDLTISAVNETTFTEIYDNSTTEDDLEFLEVKCGDSIVNVSVVLEDGTVVPYDIYLKVKRVKEIDEMLK